MKLICDRMLGKLAKKLRMLGLDTTYHEPTAKEGIIISALKENRIVLTRRTNHPTAAEHIDLIFIKDNDPENQIRQVIKHLKITKEMTNPFSVCICCNTKLKPLEKRRVEGQVADHIFNSIDSFSTCPACKKIYWSGTHHQNMAQSIDAIFE